MSEDTKKNIAGALTARPISDDRKPSPPPVPTKKIIIKSADMLPDVQKEAVNIAVAVSSQQLSLSLLLHGLLFWILFLSFAFHAVCCQKALTFFVNQSIKIRRLRGTMWRKM